MIGASAPNHSPNPNVVLVATQFVEDGFVQNMRVPKPMDLANIEDLAMSS